MSSYEQNHYEDVFKLMVKSFQPCNCVELGVLDGYSTSAIADGLQFNGRGIVKAYDLFEDYEFNHRNYADVAKKFEGNQHVEIIKKDAFSVHEEYGDRSVDFLHVDLSNDGSIIRKIMEQWNDKMVYGGLILFEGGSEERDNIEWMKKYNKEPIKPELESNKIIEDNVYVFCTYLKFPSLTVLLRKS
jgi:predicted O-methyltransferase YrrM